VSLVDNLVTMTVRRFVQTSKYNP